MQTRKLQQVGGGTYTVSIPKAWADEHALEAGMELHLYTHADGSVVVRSAETDGGDLAAAEIRPDGSDPDRVRRALRTAHAVGFETVRLVPPESFTTDQRRAARSAVRGMVGTDVLAESEESVTVKHLLDAGTVSVRQSVLQLQHTALSVHRRGTAALADGDAAAHDRLRDRGAEAARLAGMVTRHFTRSLVSFAEVDRLGVSRPELFASCATARALADVADQGVGLARVAERLDADLPEAVGAELREVGEAARSVVADATTAALDGTDAEAAHAALDDCEAALASVEALDCALFDADRTPVEDPRAAAALARALDCLGRTAERGGAIADVALQAAMRAEHTDHHPGRETADASG
jgi:phosphate uptake regulator